jgi:peptidoglycan-N-acetylglucosamine deacetylase
MEANVRSLDLSILAGLALVPSACSPTPTTPPDLVDKIYRDEFDVAYEEGGLYVLTMHPFYTGHRSRALWLEKLIVYMKTKPNIWFATHEEIARYVKTIE